MSIETIKECIMENRKLTSLEKRIYIEYAICKNHTGKMEAMKSLSTSCLENPYCKARQKKEGCICQKCYADAMLHCYSTLSEKLKINTKFLTEYELTKKDVPFINASVFRLEAFGDVKNILQVKNYYTIARANKHCKFVLWTKNVNFVDLAGTKPRNVIVIYSEPEINKIWTKSEYDIFKKYHAAVNKIFCVFTEDYIRENSIRINCGSKKCIECMTCYTTNKVWNICEKLR